MSTTAAVHPLPTQGSSRSTRKGMVQMTTTATRTQTDLVAEARGLCYDFAAKFDTPNVREGIAYAEQGRIAWQPLAALFARSYAEGVAEIDARA